MLRIAVLVLLATLSPRRADACSCVSPRSPGEAVKRADVVFVGTIGETKRLARTKFETTVTVGEVFFGNFGKTVVIASTWDGGSCDFAGFEKGEQMLIYARGKPSQGLFVSSCSGTKLLANAKEDIAFFRSVLKSKSASVGFDDNPYDDECR